MAITIKHSKVSTIPDVDNPDLVRPSDWNADHVVLGAASSGANSDITSLSGITGGIETPDYVQFDTTATPTIALGKERWNTTTGTLAFGIIDGTTEVNIGQQMYAQVVNAEAVTITKGQAVYLFQATGNKASVKLANNTSDATSAKTLGLAAQDIAAGATGFVTTQGVLDKLSTGAYNEGDTLYLGATAGSLTNVKPKAPNHLVYIGVVERANNGNGQIYVRVQNGYELDEIHDVQINSPTTGQTIVYDGITSLWKNSNSPTIIGGSIDNTPIGASTANTGSFTALTDSGNLTFTGTGNRITGDFTNATEANRVSFQTSTANSLTSVSILPSGTGTTSNIRAFNNSDPTNAAFGSIGAAVNGTEIRLQSAITGTGTYLPLTMYTGGSERLRIDTSGNVGIGTSSPSNKLDVISTTNANLIAQIRNLSNGSSAYSTYALGNDANSNAALIALNSSTNTGLGGANALNVYHGLNAPIVFFTNASERMRITSTGNVGIGTNAPVGRLSVASTTSTGNTITAWSSGYSVFGPNAGSTTGSALGLGYNTTTNISEIVSVTPNTAWRPLGIYCSDLVFYTNAGSETMRIDSNGRVGIGTSSPAYKLDVTGNVRVLNGSTAFIIDAFGAVQAPGGVYVNTSGTRTAGINSSGTDIRFRVGNADDRMILDSSGNLGLGVTPSAWNSTYKAIQIGSSSIFAEPSATNGAHFATNTLLGASGYTYINSTFATRYLQINGQHVWYNAPSGTAGNAITFTQAMTLDASGNLQLGTTTAVTSNGTNLNIYGASASNLSLQNATSGTGNANGFQLIQDGLDTYVYNRENGAMLFATNNTERMRITSGGLVGIATNSPTATLDVNADTVRVRTARTPASATAAGNAGDICWDANYIYVCTATNTWKRAAIATW